MSVHWVPLTAENVAFCAPLWADRQAYTEGELALALTAAASLLRQRRAIGALVLEGDRTVAFGISVFVDEQWIARLLDVGNPQVAKLLLLAASGTPEAAAILDRQGIAAGNAGGGLELLILNATYDTAAPDPSLILGSMFASFQHVHRGYHLARIVTQVYGDHSIDVIVRSGHYKIWHRYANVGGVKGLSSVIATTTREEAAAVSNPLLAVFVYEPPRIVFTELEQDLIRAALGGAPDHFLAEQLGVPLTAIKSRWARLQQRALNATPDAFPDLHAPHRGNTRGAQYRHVILDYVRNHPSELTPYPAVRRASTGRADRR